MSTILLLVSLLTPSAKPAETWSFPDKTGHCVAWKTRKRMLLVSTVRPVGLNCKISTKLVDGPKGKQLELRAPIAGFDSGEPSRDKEVLRILKADTQPDLLVRVSLPKEGIARLFEKQASEIAIELTIGGKAFTIPAAGFQIEEINGVKVLSGHVDTSFTAFEIEPPTVGGGVVAKVQDELELYYQLRKDKIQ